MLDTVNTRRGSDFQLSQIPEILQNAPHPGSFEAILVEEEEEEEEILLTVERSHKV